MRELREKLRTIIREEAEPMVNLKVLQLHPEVISETMREWEDRVISRIVAIVSEHNRQQMGEMAETEEGKVQRRKKVK